MSATVDPKLTADLFEVARKHATDLEEVMPRVQALLDRGADLNACQSHVHLLDALVNPDYPIKHPFIRKLLDMGANPLMGGLATAMIRQSTISAAMTIAARQHQHRDHLGWGLMAHLMDCPLNRQMAHLVVLAQEYAAQDASFIPPDYTPPAGTTLVHQLFANADGWRAPYQRCQDPDNPLFIADAEYRDRADVAWSVLDNLIEAGVDPCQPNATGQSGWKLVQSRLRGGFPLPTNAQLKATMQARMLHYATLPVDAARASPRL